MAPSRSYPCGRDAGRQTDGWRGAEARTVNRQRPAAGADHDWVGIEAGYLRLHRDRYLNIFGNEWTVADPSFEHAALGRAGGCAYSYCLHFLFRHDGDRSVAA